MTPTNGAEVALGKINDRWPLWMTPDRVEFHAKRPGWEKERLDSCAELMQPGGVVVDGGSESGDFTSWYHTLVGEFGTVIPVEPSPPYWPSCRAHWEANDLPPLKHFFPGFISDTDQTVPDLIDDAYALITPDESGWPVASLGPVLPDFGFRHLAQQAHHTPQLTLDTMMLKMGVAPDYVILDIEGAEYRALLGAERLLREVRPIFWVSIHQPIMADWYGASLGDILTFMDSVDYDSVLLGEGSEEYWRMMPR